METLTPARQQLIRTWPEVLKPWAIPKAAARIHALLLSSPDALKASEIKKILDLSDGSVSTQLRLLEGRGMVEKLRILGARKSRFRATRDPARIFLALARSRREHAFTALDRMGPTIASIADQQDLDWLPTVGHLRALAQLMDQWLELCTQRDPEWTVKSIQSLIEESTT